LAYKNIEPFSFNQSKSLDIEQDVAQHEIFSSALAFWHKVNGKLSLTAIQDHPEVFNKALVAELHDDRGGLFYSYIGPEADILKYYGQSWSEKALGNPIIDVGDDWEYASSVWSAYWGALQKNKPCFEDILGFSYPDGLEAMWMPYKRLVLPCEKSDGTATVVVLCLMTHEIDIPLMAG
jgi:hypothetical protein